MTRNQEYYEQAYEFVEKNHGEANNDFQAAMNIAVQKAFVAGAKWADKTMIEKACEFLSKRVFSYDDNFSKIRSFLIEEKAINDFEDPNPFVGTYFETIQKLSYKINDELVEKVCEFLYTKLNEAEIDCRNIEKLIENLKSIML